jgi:hypothetical protein
VNDVLLLNVHNRVNMRGEFVVYDAQGKVVKRLNRTMQAGNYQIAIAAEDLPSGAYVIGYESPELVLKAARFIKR